MHESILPSGVHDVPSPMGIGNTTDVFPSRSAQRKSVFLDLFRERFARFREPDFDAFVDSDDTDAVWFVWLPTFDHPILVRAMRHGATYALIGVELDGKGGYDPGKVRYRNSREIDAAAWRSLTAPLGERRFWNPATPDGMGLDGSFWLVAASSGGSFYVTNRWSPRKGGPHDAVRSFGVAMLRAAKLASEPIY